LGYVDGSSLYLGYFAPQGIDPFGLEDGFIEWMWNSCGAKVGQCNTLIFTGVWVEGECTSGGEVFTNVHRGGITGQKAVVNGVGSACISLVTLGTCSDNYEIIAVNDWDRSVGYDTAVICTRVGGEVLVAVSPAQAAKLAQLGHLGKANQVVINGGRALTYVDLAASGVGASLATSDILENDFTCGNMTQLGFSLVGAAGSIPAIRSLPNCNGKVEIPVVNGKQSSVVYRGVNSNHFDFEVQCQGVVRPNNQWWQFWKGKGATPHQHNAGQGGTLNSPYTSWTTDPRVARNFALRPGGTSGVIIKAVVPTSRLIASPNTKCVNLIQGGGVVSESEVLLRGTVRGSIWNP